MIRRPRRQPVRRSLHRRPSILIIDSDEILREALSRRLQQQGFDMLTAASGQRGLESARQHRPDVILLELRLPDLDGLDVCAQLADDPETCFIPVIVVTGMEDPDILRRSRSAGCHFFLLKPFDPNALLALIRQSLRDARHIDESVA